MNTHSSDTSSGATPSPTAEAGGTPTLRNAAPNPTADGGETPPRRRTIRRLLRTALAFVLGALLLEGVCWAVRDLVLPPKWSKNPDTDRMEPGFSGTIDYADTVEGRGARLGQLRVNSLGFRGPDPKLSNERTPGRLRVYCLGSSTTFGWGASRDETAYPAQLERILKERRGDLQVEVINAGVPGNNSESELKILKEDLPRLKPDIVILWSGWPDWTHYLQPEGRKRQDKDWLEPLRKTNAYRLAEFVRDGVTPRPQPPAFEEMLSRPGLGKYREAVLEKWRKNLAAMIDVSREHGCAVQIIGLASPLARPVETWDAVTRQQASNRLFTLREAAPKDLPASIARFEETLTGLGEEYLKGASLPSDASHFFDGVHMKDEGYRALAEKIAEHVLKLIPSP